MDNTRLSRRVDIAKRDFESIIDDLIAEIEELEGDKDKMQHEIDDLIAAVVELEDDKDKMQHEIDALMERISDLEVISSAVGKK